MKNERLVRSGLALSVFFAGCGKITPSPETTSPAPITSPTPEPTRTPSPIPTITKPPTLTPTPTITETPTVTPTPTPNYRETQEVEWMNLENAERKEPIELTNVQITRILFGGGYYWVEANVPGEEGITLLQSDCVKDALEESEELGRQVDRGIYQPNSRIDILRGNVKLPSGLVGGVVEESGIKIPIVDLVEIENEGKLYNCDVVTADEATISSVKDAYDALRPVLERVYPRVRQFGRIIGNLLDLAERATEP